MAARRLRLGVCLAMVFGCSSRDEGPLHRGPIVLITIDALRADVVSGLGGPAGLTPSLDSLIAEATWSGRAISTSSWTVPSMASIFTGLQPWSHGNWHGKFALLQSDLETLPEALQALGYRTRGFGSNRWLARRFGYDQGFDQLGSFARVNKLKSHLSSLDGGPDFVWIHILKPHAPYLYHERFRDRLPDPGVTLPKRLRPQDLEPFYDPSVELPAAFREQAWQLYLMNVARADAQLGMVLSVLRKGGHWDSSVVVVTSDHGEEFGENGQVLHGGSLHRVLIEVPLIVKLPADLGVDMLEPGETVANHRIFSTLVELAGGKVRPETAPSLFESISDGVLSELYTGNGSNLFSLVEGDRQLVWESHFAPPDPDFFRVRRAHVGIELTVPLDEPADQILDREFDRFLRVPALRGLPGSPPSVREWIWREGSVVVESETQRSMTRRLEDRWKALNGPDVRPAEVLAQETPELSQEDLARLRALGYVNVGEAARR